MTRRILTAAMAVALSVVAPRVVVAQPTSGATSSQTAKPAKAKLIKFQLRNDSGAPLTVQAGDVQQTVNAGQTVSFKVQEGLQMIAVSGTPHVAAGGVLTTVTSELDGNTLAVR